MAHLGKDPLPEGVYEPDEAAVVRYARASTLLQPIDDELYNELTRYFDVQQLIELCMTVGLSNQVNRFHATFLTDRDEVFEAALGASCPLPIPPKPGTR
jgi:alkylhydroperoxidase family enzyme